tara:strand:+ start:564 stop:704 length:141 start_codon:yes stop_codon:yes gene_type:complete
MLKKILNTLKIIKRLPSLLIERGKRFEEVKAGKKWDSIIEELKNRK